MAFNTPAPRAGEINLNGATLVVYESGAVGISVNGRTFSMSKAVAEWMRGGGADRLAEAIKSEAVAALLVDKEQRLAARWEALAKDYQAKGIPEGTAKSAAYMEVYNKVKRF